MSDQNEYSNAVNSFLNPAPAAPNVQAGLSLAAGANPDFEAELRKLSAKTGVPLETARNMPDEIKRQAFMKDANPGLLQAQYPKVAAFLSDPDNAAVAKDDIGTMQKMSNLWASFSQGINRGSVQDQLGPLHYRALVGDITPAEEAERKRLRGVLDQYGAGAEREEGLAYALNQTGYTGRQVVSGMREGLKGAAVGAAAGAGVGFVAGNATGIGIALPEEIATVPGGALFGGRTGYIASSVIYNYKQEAGFAFDEFENYRDASGARLDRDTARGAAASVGLVNAGLETIGDLAMAKLFPGLDNLLSQGGRGMVKELLKRPTFRAAVTEAGKRWLKVGATEGVTEAIQELSTIVAGEIAQNVGGIEAINQQPAGERIATAGRDALVGALGVGLPGASYQGYRGVRQAQQAQQNQDFMQALGEDAAASKLRERMPEKFREFIAKAKEGGPIDNVYIPVEQFSRYFQEAGVNPADVAFEVGAKNYSEALATGTDVVIPIEDYATFIAPTEHHAQLMQDARLHQGDMTPREAEAFMQEREQRMQEIADQFEVSATDTQAPAYNTLFNDMMGELTGRFERSTAEAYATLYARGINALAERAGVDPLALHQQYGLNVVTQLPQILTNVQQSDINIDPLLDMLRAGQRPSDTEIFGPSLSEFVRTAGGMQDPGGELRGLDADKELRPFQRKLVNEKGKQPDYMREAAAEAGYMDDGGYLNDFLDLLDDDVRGTPVYSMRNRDDAKFELRQTLDALAEALDRVGVDITALSNEQIRAAMNAGSEAAEGATQYAQGAQDQTETPEFKAWSNNAPVYAPDQLDEYEGGPAVFRLYHGTASDFTEFDRERANPESDLGAGFYFTNNPDDVSSNYAGEGPDLTQRIQLLAERIAGDTDRDYSDPDVLAEAREQLAVTHGGMAMPVFVKVQNPLLLGGENETFLDYSQEYNEELDEYGDETGSLVDFIVALRDVASQYNDGEVEGAIDAVMQQAMDSGGISASELIAAVKGAEEFNYYADENGVLVGSDIIRQAFESAGFDGIVDFTVDEKFGSQRQQGTSMSGMDEETVHVIAFEPTQIKSAIGNRGTFDPNDANILNQTERGFIQFGKERKFSITLLENADLSTFLHEMGHFYLEVLGDLANAENAAPQVAEDFATLLKWFGVESRDQIQTEHHEKFARGFEAYLMEGKAPSAELRGMFQRFKAWLTLIYKRIASLNVQLNDDVRGVFDRLLATEEEIANAERGVGVQGIFATAADAGMSEVEFAAYRKTVEQANSVAQEELQQKLMAEYQRAREQWYRDETKKVRSEVTQEIEAQREYKAFDALVAGRMPDGTPIKLNRDDLVARYGTEYIKRLPRGFQRVYAAEGGMTTDMAAEVLGFQSGDELVQGLVNLRPKRELIEAETTARMRERHGDMLTDGSIAEQAMEAVQNDQRAKVLSAELRALNRRAREVRPVVNALNRQDAAERRAMQDSIPPLQAFHDMARGMVGQQQVRDLQPGRYLNAQRKASREAFDLAAKGSYQEAAAAKQRELLNHFLHRESVKALTEVEKAVDYATSLQKAKAQERIGKAGEQYLSAINEILIGYEFRKVSGARLDRTAQLRESVRAAMTKAANNGEVLDIMTDEDGNIIDPALLSVRNYRELAVDELLAVRDMLKNIDHISRETGKFRAAEVKATFDDIAQQGIAEMQSGLPDKELEQRSLRDPMNERKRAIAGIPQAWRSLYSYILEASGFRENSTLWNYIVRPLNDAAARESVMLRDANLKLTDLFKRYDTTYLYGKGQMLDGVGPLNKQEQLMIAASYGTETGRQRLRDNGFNGVGFTQQQIDSVLNTLEERDWQFVQELWALFDSYWQQVEDKQQRVTGVRPEKVAAVPFMTRFGMMPGGYSPIAYESRTDNRAAAQDAALIAKEMGQAAYTRSTTRRGFTKARVEKLEGKKVRYDFGVIYKHLNEVIHDLTHHEALRDVQKLLNHKVGGTSIIDEITRRMGDGVRDQVRGTLEDIAVGDMRVLADHERVVERLAKGASMASMAYNVWNAVQNATGVFNSMAVVGAANFVGGGMRWAGKPAHMLAVIDEVNAKSEFMQTRFLNMNRDINAMRGKLEQMTGKPVVDNALEAYKAGGFWLLVRMQQLVDVPTWLGAYEAAKRADPNITEANAVALADQAVIAAQGGGRTVDLSQFMRGKGFARVWTVFAGYFNVVYQRSLESMKRAKAEDYSPAAVGRTIADLGFLLVAPALVTTMMKEAIDRMVGGDEDDWDELFLEYLKEQFGYMLAMFPYVRETAAGLLGYGTYSGPVGARFFKDLNDLARQSMQGDADEGLAKAAVKTVGSLTGAPTGQLLKIYDGAVAMEEEGATPLALVFGAPKKD